MNYPVWDIPGIGGSFLIALVATVHVYVSHFAVGGGLFLVVTEMMARRSNNLSILEYVHRHTRFFLLVTMVLGALTGFGIWQVISVVNPAATSLLIHTFVFGWATEWVCFVVEIVSLLVYYYTFERMEARAHVIVGWIYFIFAWLSLVLIGGIVSFMLTPGQWMETGSFWSGLFNPSFLPSIAFRTFFSLVLAGVYGLITSTFIREGELRQKMVRYCVLWLAAPFVLLLPSAWWYFEAVPPQAKEMILGKSPELVKWATAFMAFTPIVFLGGIFMAVRLSQVIQRSMAFVLLVMAFLYMGSFEMVREAGRRPYIIHGTMYSNSILKSHLPQVQKMGVLRTAKWARHKEISEGSRLAAGAELFKMLCLPCHSVGGPLNDMLERTRGLNAAGLQTVMQEQGGVKGWMPPGPGTAQEREILAFYIIEELRAKRTP
jgi:cytochrome bd-type quinol oxidase subunit 1